MNRATPDRSIPTESDAGSHILAAALLTGPSFLISPTLGAIAGGLQIMWGMSKARQRSDYHAAHAARIKQAMTYTPPKPTVGIPDPYSRVTLADGQPSAPAGHWEPNTMQF